MKKLSIAIDSMPISNSSDNCTDYSAHQIFSLCTSPINANQIESSIDGKNHTLYLNENEFWSHGSHINELYYFELIKNIIKKESKKAEKIFLFDCYDFKTKPFQITFKTKYPNYFLKKIIALKAFSPSCKLSNKAGFSAGPYFIDKQKKNKVLLKKNEFYKNDHLFNNSPQEIEFIQVINRFKNIELFEKNLIEQTADTAFPFDYYEKYFKSSDFFQINDRFICFLAFENEITHELFLDLRTYITESIDREELRNCVSNNIECAYGFSKKVVFQKNNTKKCIKKFRTIIITYDDFYPNHKIARQIQIQLSRAGINCKILKDTFGNQKVIADIRLKLYENNLDKDIGIYYSLLLDHNLLNKTEVRDKIFNYLLMIRAKKYNKLEYMILKIEQILYKYQLYIPLLFFPSIGLSKIKDSEIFKRVLS